MELFRDGNRNPEEVLDVFQIVKGHRDFMAVLRGTAKPNLRYDRRQDGWELLEHIPCRISSVAGLEAVSFLQSGESSIRGYDVIGRARYELGADYGQEDAEYLLEHQDEISVEFRKYYLVFTGTVWRGSDRHLVVTCLDFVGRQWYLFWHLLERGFYSRVRVLRPGK